MACKWRIRHKLMVGLGLVVSILALQLAGTLKGLLSYGGTMKSIDSKLTELHEAGEFKARVNALLLLRWERAALGQQLEEFREKVHRAQAALTKYEEKLRETLERRRDPDKGIMEQELLAALHGHFTDLEAALQEIVRAPRMHSGQSPMLLDEPRVKNALVHLRDATEQLWAALYEDMYRSISQAKGDNRRTLTILIATSVLSVLLMSGMLRSFYRWVFNPVRDLEIGAGRVAQGDFDHRIEVRSGDEMQDLAAAFNDMTTRLREIYRDLAHQVNERSRQLVRSERLASVGFLAAGVAHEINNPLASIAFCSEALESRLAPLVARSTQDGEVVAKYLRMIQQEAFRCKGITQRLLEFSRTGEPVRERTNLGELVESVLEMVRHLPNMKGKEIQFQPTATVEAWINAQEVKSVVLNLVVNALDSMDEGGRLTIQLRQRDRGAEITFADTGCGMSQEVLENIFEPFYTRSRTGKGTGLGLSISHRIIAQHGGEIGATSPGPGQGSTFTVRLPLQPADSSKEESLGHAAA